VIGSTEMPPGGDLLVKALVEDDDAIGDVFLQPVARQRVFGALARDDGSQSAIFQPTEEAAQFRAEDGVIGQAGKQGFDGVEDHAFRADGLDGMAEPDEQPFEVVLARLLDLAALDLDVIEGELLLRDEFFEIEAERADIGCQFGRALLEHHEHAGVAMLCRPAHEELRGEHGLS
jgi:hypothetical protein